MLTIIFQSNGFYLKILMHKTAYRQNIHITISSYYAKIKIKKNINFSLNSFDVYERSLLSLYNKYYFYIVPLPIFNNTFFLH